jgi:hypothetical protein
MARQLRLYFPHPMTIPAGARLVADDDNRAMHTSY